jgi:DNA-binding beta-propeller fold protein YncE/plastocyanin
MNRFTYGLTAAVIASMLLTGTVLASPMAITNILTGLPTIFNTATALPGSGITHTISMTAETLPNGQDAYKMTSHSASAGTTPTYSNMATIPGPTLIVGEGDTVQVTLTNNIAGKAVGFNVPGLLSSNAKASTGTSKTYTFTAGSAGTYLYQNKDDALLGLFGAIVVNPASGPVGKYVNGGNGAVTSADLNELEREYVLFMVGSTFWGQEIDDNVQTPLWTNPMLGADLNELVRFHILSVGPGHTFHLHAHRWVESTTNENIIDTRLMKDGFDTHTFIVESGADVGEGAWQYHCHVFAHMEAGMHGTFHVGMSTSVAGASPYNGHPVLGHGASTAPGLVTFIISDEPGSWFKSARGDALSGVLVSKSLEVARVGDYVNFVMSDTDTVHTITSLLWPTGAEHMPMDEVQSYKGGGIVQLTDPGLYVFTCKVHPYMFGAVIADDLTTPAVELGETINLVQYPGLDFPTASDLATRLLRTFFIATVPDNWQDYSSTDPWHVSYPDLAPAGILFRVGTGLPDPATLDVDLKAVLESRYGQDITLTSLEDPTTPGIGEVWIDTQFEKTAGKVKPGTATAVDTSTWTVSKKIALPQVNMNNPHNMWTDKDQTVIYQTEWFSNKLTTFDRQTGALISQIKVGEAPSHVMTRANNDDIHVALNGEEGVAEIYATTSPAQVNRIIATQGYGQDPTHPHAHWMSHDGQKMVTPNSFTGDSTLFGFDTNSIEAKPATGALPIATGMMPDASKYYVANLLHSTISVIDMDTGVKIKDINGLEDYNPLAIPELGGVAIEDGAWPLDGPGPFNGILQLGALPIQTPVSPDGQYMVTANTLSATITVVDTETDEIVVTMFCDAGCHGVNFGAKQGGGYYAYVSSKFSNAMIVVDGDPNGDGNPSDAAIVGRILLTTDNGMTTDTPTPVAVTANDGMGGQGVLAIPNVYNGWVQNLPQEWLDQLTEEQKNPVT